MPLHAYQLRGDPKPTPQQQELMRLIGEIPVFGPYAGKFTRALTGTVEEAATKAATKVVIGGLIASGLIGALFLGIAIKTAKKGRK